MNVTVRLVDEEWGESEAKQDFARFAVMRRELALIASIAGVDLATAFAQVCTLGIDVFIAEYGKEQLRRKRVEIRLLVEAGPGQ